MSQEALKFIRGLSPEQRAAALTTDDPVMIVAGAGSGKTRTLIGRFLHLVMPESAGGLQADPNSVMMVTFTNKAAREMNERIKPVLEDLRSGSERRMSQGDPWIGTFHGLSLRILRVEAARAGLGRNFSIFDDSDASALATDVAESLDMGRFDVDEFFRDLEKAKARLFTPDLLLTKEAQITEAISWGKPLDPILHRWAVALDHFETPGFTQIYAAYQRSLDDQNAVDFSDLMNRVTRLFQEHPDIRDSWRSQFRHFMVDEVQDINRAQVAWLMALTDGGRVMPVPDNVAENEYSNASDGMHEVNTYRLRRFPRPTVAFVGDDDQSIYAFRGSEIAVMKSLEKKFPGMEMRFLKESYRCQPSILSVANELVANNTGRYGKELEPADPSRAANHVRITKMFHADNELEMAVKSARDHIAGGGNPSEFAILLRTRDLSKAVARELRSAGLPVVEGKASDIRKTAEVRDAMAFTGFLTNRDAETLMRRIINKPARGLGPTSLATVQGNAKLKGITFVEEMRSLMNGKVELPNGAIPYKKAFMASCKEFGTLVTEMRRAADAAPNAGAAVHAILETSGYLRDLKEKAISASDVGRDRAPELMALAPKDFLSALITFGEDKKKNKKPEKSLEERFPDLTDEARAVMAHEDLADRAGQLSEAARRIGNLSVLIAQAERFTHLDEFMQEAMLEMDQSESVAGIQVMTIHASKGLEFDHVRLPFWIEGVMPHARADKEGEDAVEEERRLAYVALTRARETVSVSYPMQVRGFHAIRTNDVKPSRFIEEMCAAPEHDFIHRNLFNNGRSQVLEGGKKRDPVAPRPVSDEPEWMPNIPVAAAPLADDYPPMDPGYDDSWRSELHDGDPRADWVPEGMEDAPADWDQQGYEERDFSDYAGNMADEAHDAEFRAEPAPTPARGDADEFCPF